MLEIAIALLASSVISLAILFRIQQLKFRKTVMLQVQAIGELTKTIESMVLTIGEHQKLFRSQHEMNEMIAKHLEVLGVHTKLLKPTIGYEAEAYLAWINKKKEERDEV